MLFEPIAVSAIVTPRSATSVEAVGDLATLIPSFQRSLHAQFFAFLVDFGEINDPF
jgi:hypothetical protein